MAKPKPRKKSYSPHDAASPANSEDRDLELAAAPAKPVRKVGPPKLTPKKLRIIAGELRGRRVVYNGDPAVRPMKDRTRESVFSLLGGYLHGTMAVDLFGGTGILAIESVSRGSERGVILELSRPAVSTIVDNLKQLRLDEQIEVHNVDTLRWLKSIEINVRSWPKVPWMIFCCPPYRLWHEQTDRLVSGIEELLAISPEGSRIVCETEQDFDVAGNLPALDWDVRPYKPAIISIATKDTP